jgi:23S rRNA (cytidine2498-2'-O)-methyltransferase
MPERPQFLFVTCQIGAEKAVKGELSRRWPDFHFAFSRPGFLTFKLPADCSLEADFDLHSVFARAYGFSLGRVAGDDLDSLARSAWETFSHRPCERIHVWQRDAAEPGEHSFEPAISSAAEDAYAALRTACPRPERLAAEGSDLHEAARPGQRVLDCILLDTGQWCVGYHQVRSVPSQWPGGLMGLTMPANAVSRAWLKMEESLRWAKFPIAAGAQWAEIGSAPGGSSQALLQRGYRVMGVDPAEMDPLLLNNPDFTHIRRRVTQVQRRDFRKIRWLAADMNVAPSYTLDAVESIVTHRDVRIRGMLLTLKLPQWKLAECVPEYLSRIRDWGYNIVRARQLQNNHREFCVAALQKPFRK